MSWLSINVTFFENLSVTVSIQLSSGVGDNVRTKFIKII